jgi:predicted O-linked N-acetylglucosamine transferase (SPINDLY family)
MAKVSDRAVAAWAEIIGRVPGSRLALKNKALGDVPARHRLQARFAAYGVGAERLWMSGAIDSLAGHLAAYSFVDLGLDTFPYTGTTTTCEAMWMGVPVVSYAGSAHVERVGASVLAAAGLAEFTAHDERGYVELAVGAAASLERLASLRASLRERLSASPLLDEVSFTLRLEAVYRQLWRRWCAQQS